ncbi:hypothetical protein [Neolewinella antarctica]|uniref:Uncharacterized membrane protein YebE (DUF533 family) n=1 Tax=Neolewinella antarctica TaxID=442734 RepID=A0ABX0XHB0_9BACT|nr:hypothetical protein [Neolewinella antarctica]NJC28251.1 uncharacterized membrane protein YebE (DUF533 family) [Neolewinella antarctica]
MDFLITIALIYFAYRGYQWYQATQAQVKSGGQQPPEVDADFDFDSPTRPQPGDENDYIDYEEIKSNSES